jgi:hypothetical protein
MPTFKSVKGGHIYLHCTRVLHAETGPGGLTTVITAAGVQPGTVIQTEVEEPCHEVGDKLAAEWAAARS